MRQSVETDEWKRHGDAGSPDQRLCHGNHRFDEAEKLPSEEIAERDETSVESRDGIFHSRSDGAGGTGSGAGDARQKRSGEHVRMIEENFVGIINGADEESEEQDEERFGQLVQA